MSEGITLQLREVTDRPIFHCSLNWFLNWNRGTVEDSCLLTCYATLATKLLTDVLEKHCAKISVPSSNVLVTF